MTEHEVREAIRRHLEDLMVDRSDDGSLDLDSLAVVNLHDRLERSFDIRIRALEVTPERFGSLEALVELVLAKRHGGRS